MGNARSLEAALRNLSGQTEDGPEPLEEPQAGLHVREDPPSDPESAAPSLGSGFVSEVLLMLGRTLIGCAEQNPEAFGASACSFFCDVEASV